MRAEAGLRGEPGDALWTDEPRLPLLVLTADCLPIVLVRVGGPPAVAVVHAGWRGLLDGVVANAVAALGRASSPPRSVRRSARAATRWGRRSPRRSPSASASEVLAGGHLDLRAAATSALAAVGVARVDHIDRCTSCDPEQLFFSHRRDRGVTGRQGVLAAIG